VYRLNDTTAIVNTIDFFTPIVDDPFEFGQIAAANALSDVYAMGGSALTAMNIVCFPAGKLPFEVLGRIMEGSLTKVREAGALPVGGHSVDDPEIKFGLAVTGIVHPERVLTNSGAQPGSAILLSKALGTGILTTAVKLKKAKPDVLPPAIESMSRLNKTASEIALRHSASSVTDITGFGLLGHASEMARGSGVKLQLHSEALPLLPETHPLAVRKVETMVYSSNVENLGDFVEFRDVSDAYHRIMLEAETSGGLLIALPEEKAEDALAELKETGHAAARIGLVAEGQGIVVD
jgi:selenide,water dikinase